MKVKSIIIEIKGEDVSLTLQEAQELKDALDTIISEDNSPSIRYPQMPYQPPAQWPPDGGTGNPLEPFAIWEVRPEHYIQCRS